MLIQYIENVKKVFSSSIPNNFDKIIFFNVGTNKVEFDSFGPIFGSCLEEELKYYGDEITERIIIMGNLTDNCNGVTLSEKFNEYDLINTHSSFTIATDACVSTNEERMGILEIRTDRGVKPGFGVGKNFREIGDISMILATVNEDEAKTPLYADSYYSFEMQYQICRELACSFLDILLEKICLKQVI